MVVLNNDLERCRQQMRDFLLSFAPETPVNELDELLSEYTLEHFKKKQIILAEGVQSNFVYFVCNGLVRVYFVKDGKELTNWFISENMSFASSFSLFGKEKNDSVFEAVEDTLVLKIDFFVLESYYRKYHALEHIGRKVVERYYFEFLKKSHEVSFFSAEERYFLFSNNHSDLLNRLPLKLVASYLGISQETLSRIRAKH